MIPIRSRERKDKMIEMGKEYRYRKGGKAIILTTSRPNCEWTVVSMSEVGRLTTHYPDGKTSQFRDDDDDLVEIIPFADFQKDEPVLVRNSDKDAWKKRHFSYAGDGVAWAFDEGKTSWSSEGFTSFWYQCRRPTPEEMGLKD